MPIERSLLRLIRDILNFLPHLFDLLAGFLDTLINLLARLLGRTFGLASSQAEDQRTGK